MKPLRQPAIVAAGALALAGAFLTGCLEQPNPINPTVVVIPDFTITDLRVGTGVAAANGNFLDVDYTLWLYDVAQPDNKGVQVESTGGTPFNFVLGGGQVIAGWEQGLVGMRAGGARRLIIPPALAFGTAGSNTVPPNTSLVFDIELRRVDEAPPFTITDLRAGTGAESADGNTLTVEYVGWVYDPTETDNKGLQFDASSGTPFSFVLGGGLVILGWEQGLLGMRVGGERRLIIPPELAYGAEGNGQILPNATILFDVELLTVE